MAYDFEKMKWQIHQVPLNKSVFDAIPEIKELFSPIQKTLDKVNDITADKLVRYIIYVYHQRSPLAINEQNVIKRKVDALNLLELEPQKLTSLIANKNIEANFAKMHFLKHENNFDWVELCQYTEIYYSVMNALTDDAAETGSKSAADIAKVKLATVKDMKVIKSEMDSLSLRLFRNDVDIHEKNYKGLGNFVASFLEEEKRALVLPEDFVAHKKKEHGKAEA